MMRPRFSSGLVVGLACGMPVGALVALFALPPRGGLSLEQEQALTALRGDVEALRETSAGAGHALGNELRDALGQLGQERERVKTQMGLFEELAAQVAANLAKVDTRLEGIERRSNEPAPAPAPERYEGGTQPDTYPRERPPRRYQENWD